MSPKIISEKMEIKMLWSAHTESSELKMSPRCLILLHWFVCPTIKTDDEKGFIDVFVFCWPQPVSVKHGTEKAAFSTITHYIFTPLPWVFLFSSQPCILTRCVKFRQPQALNDSSPSHSLSAAYWSCAVSTFRLSVCWKCQWLLPQGPGEMAVVLMASVKIKMLRLSRPSSIWEQSKYTINHMHTGLGDKLCSRYYSNSLSPSDSFFLLQGNSESIFSHIF